MVSWAMMSQEASSSRLNVPIEAQWPGLSQQASPDKTRALPCRAERTAVLCSCHISSSFVCSRSLMLAMVCIAWSYLRSPWVTCLAKSSFSSDTKTWLLVPITWIASHITDMIPSSCSCFCRFLLCFPCRQSGNGWMVYSVLGSFHISSTSGMMYRLCME